MNPRRVHALMRARFPQSDPAGMDWVNVLEADGTLRGATLGALVDEFIGADEILVEVHRKLGKLLPREQLLAYLQAHIGKGTIRLAGRDFRGCVLVGTNGVAAGWTACGAPVGSAPAPVSCGNE